MANLSPEQEAMNRAHSDNGRTCLPNCWRRHDSEPVYDPEAEALKRMQIERDDLRKYEKKLAPQYRHEELWRLS